MASSAKTKKTKKSFSFLTGIGLGLVIFSLYLFARLFHDPLKQELKYSVRTSVPTESLTPINTDFSLVIDKIGAKSAIVAQVDAGNSRLYQVALKSGIAQAKGTAFPGEGHNIFLFAHSSADLLTAQRYNSVFYLMHHLIVGDQIRVWYQGIEHIYSVEKKLIVDPSDTKYLSERGSEETLTLMTCWPAGTTFKRLIVIAKPL